MSRSRLIGGLLMVILLACAAVIVLDQMGVFGTTTASAPNTPVTPNNTVPATPTNGSGYGGLK